MTGSRYNKDQSGRPTQRLQGVLAHLDPHSDPSNSDPQLKPTSVTTMTTTRTLPTFDELPHFGKFSGCAWDVWGKGDQLGTVNLLTEEVVKEAAKEIKYVSHTYQRDISSCVLTSP